MFLLNKRSVIYLICNYVYQLSTVQYSRAVCINYTVVTLHTTGGETFPVLALVKAKKVISKYKPLVKVNIRMIIWITPTPKWIYADDLIGCIVFTMKYNYMVGFFHTCASLGVSPWLVLPCLPDGATLRQVRILDINHRKLLRSSVQQHGVLMPFSQWLTKENPIRRYVLANTSLRIGKYVATYWQICRYVLAAVALSLSYTVTAYSSNVQSDSELPVWTVWTVVPSNKYMHPANGVMTHKAQRST